MAFVEDQVHHVAAAVDAAAGNPVPVLAAPGAGVNNVHGGSARVFQTPSHACEFWFDPSVLSRF